MLCGLVQNFNQAGLNAGGACLFKNASIGCSVLPADTLYSSERALLKLFKSFDVATEHYPCFAAIQRCEQHGRFAYKNLSKCPKPTFSEDTAF